MDAARTQLSTRQGLRQKVDSRMSFPLQGHAWLKDDEAMHCRQCEKFSVSQRNVCGGSTHPPSALSHCPLRFPFLWFQKPASDQAHCPVTVLTGWQMGSPTSPACLCRWLSIPAPSFWEALASHRPLVSSTSLQELTMIWGEMGLLVPSCSRGLSLKILCVRQDRNLAQLRQKQSMGNLQGSRSPKITGDLGRVLVPVF